MSVISMKQLLEAGVHFGHQTRRWNPKMAWLYFLPSMKLDGEQLRKVDLLADIRPDVEEIGRAHV